MINTNSELTLRSLQEFRNTLCPNCNKVGHIIFGIYQRSCINFSDALYCQACGQLLIYNGKGKKITVYKR